MLSLSVLPESVWISLLSKCRICVLTVTRSAMCLSSRVNFKEPEAVRALTCTLLKEDFGLTIEIPLERLIPTVPLRLNYIHWVEDLTGGQKQPRRGIDIGNTTTVSVTLYILKAAPFASLPSSHDEDAVLLFIQPRNYTGFRETKARAHLS